jgi:hypothetical protein
VPKERIDKERINKEITEDLLRETKKSDILLIMMVLKEKLLSRQEISFGISFIKINHII